jgi:hypothetical protein
MTGGGCSPANSTQQRRKNAVEHLRRLRQLRSIVTSWEHQDALDAGIRALEREARELRG